MTLQEQRVYEFDPYRVDPAKRLLLRDGEAVPLTPKCFEILLVLVENSGQVVEEGIRVARACLRRVRRALAVSGG